MNSLISEDQNSPAADWTPSPESLASSNIAWLMEHLGVDTFEQVHAWTTQHRDAYWKLVAERLEIKFHTPWSKVLDQSAGVESPSWFPGAKINIVESCFTADDETPAIISQAEGGQLQTLSYGELQVLTGRVATNIRRLGFQPGDALAILMPMTVEAVAIYLGIIQAGCVVVGIADSFRPKEIVTRLRISNTKGIFTQDVLIRGGKTLPLYANAIAADAPTVIVLPAREQVEIPLRDRDVAWDQFLQPSAEGEMEFDDTSAPINILFSSGTTGDPKAIPWTHLTPLKCAADAHFHQDVQPNDVVVWPTNLGWMMGPWLIFASLLNRATIGLYYGAPTGREFGQFVQAAKTTMLGVIPSLVKNWRGSGCMQGLDWSSIKLFSSTGECSSAEEMRWLMQLAGGRPVIEYCGGTEIAGGYLTGTIARPCVAGMFNAPVLGIDFQILDEQGQQSESGEVFLVPPGIGISTSLLNKNHHELYFEGTPPGIGGETLRRHGDQIQALPGGYWRAQGRTDDTMNLGGIKVSSAEIEQVLQLVPDVIETAAVAVSEDGGPSQLVIYAVCSDATHLNQTELAASMQNALKSELNPLFKIHELILVDALPRTPSNKIMRRILRDQKVTPQ